MTAYRQRQKLSSRRHSYK